jgi:uncharacterized metal-binding protein YceD (DUF177 family)
MRFDVTALLRAPVGSVQTFRLAEELGPPAADGFAEEMEGDVSLLRTSEGILTTAHLQVKVADCCCRCLKPVSIPLEVDFQEEYLPTVDADTGSRLAVIEDGDGFLIDDRQVLDLSEAVRQYRLAVQPIQALCRTDCKGLCASCGEDLNYGPCSCDAAAIEPPMHTVARVTASKPKANDRRRE